MSISSASHSLQPAKPLPASAVYLNCTFLRLSLALGKQQCYCSNSALTHLFTLLEPSSSWFCSHSNALFHFDRLHSPLLRLWKRNPFAVRAHLEQQAPVLPSVGCVAAKKRWQLLACGWVWMTLILPVHNHQSRIWTTCVTISSVSSAKIFF